MELLVDILSDTTAPIWDQLGDFGWPLSAQDTDPAYGLSEERDAHVYLDWLNEHLKGYGGKTRVIESRHPDVRALCHYWAERDVEWVRMGGHWRGRQFDSPHHTDNGSTSSSDATHSTGLGHQADLGDVGASQAQGGVDDMETSEDGYSGLGMGDQGDFSGPVDELQSYFGDGHHTNSFDINTLVHSSQTSHNHSSGHSVSNWPYLDMNGSIDDLGGSAHLLGGQATGSASGQYGVGAQVGPDLGGFNGAGGGVHGAG